MVSGAIVLVLALLLAWAVGHLVKKAKYGGGCCGEHVTAEKKIRVKDKTKSHYPFSVMYKIEGMTCESCARRVENALNALDGIWADVDIGSHMAKIRLKSPPDEKQLIRVIAEAGYSVSHKASLQGGDKDKKQNKQDGEKR